MSGKRLVLLYFLLAVGIAVFIVSFNFSTLPARITGHFLGCFVGMNAGARILLRHGRQRRA